MERRDLLRKFGVATSVGLTGLAGCFGDGQGDGAGGQCAPNEPNYRGWFEGVSNYTCTIDARGGESYTVLVGVQGNSGFYKFGPAAVAVSPATTITWEWTGKGGTHNIVAEQGAFDSGKPVDTKGHAFQHTFDRPGIYKYVCEPHRSFGMKGAIFVTLE